MSVLLIVVVIAVILIAFVVGVYNKLVVMRNRKDEAWSDIDVQLKRRYDLIPNLVNTVKGYAEHEKQAFESVTEARSKALGAQSVEEQAEAENMLTGALKSIFAISEAYPELKANENFKELQRELSDTENKIQAARRFYNTNVMGYNTALQVFPNNLIVGMFKFKEAEFFELDESEAEAKDPVEVNF